MKEYIDRSFFVNPVSLYFKWLVCKSKYQLKYWGSHLRIGYLSAVNNSTFGKYNWIGQESIVANSSLGDFTYVNSFSYVLWATIGRYCSIGPNVKIAPGKHPSSGFVSTHPATFNNQSNFVRNFAREPKFKNYQPVTIGNDVWIGANSIIIDGVTIGDGAIIAANSVVVKDVGPYEIVGGNPARFIRKRFDDNSIDFLVKTKWWNNDPDWLEENISRFWNIDDFVLYPN